MKQSFSLTRVLELMAIVLGSFIMMCLAMMVINTTGGLCLLLFSTILGGNPAQTGPIMTLSCALIDLAGLVAIAFVIMNFRLPQTVKAIAVATALLYHHLSLINLSSQNQLPFDQSSFGLMEIFVLAVEVIVFSLIFRANKMSSHYYLALYISALMLVAMIFGS